MAQWAWRDETTHALRPLPSAYGTPDAAHLPYPALQHGSHDATSQVSPL